MTEYEKKFKRYQELSTAREKFDKFFTKKMHKLWGDMKELEKIEKQKQVKPLF